MTIKEFKTFFTSELQTIYPLNEIDTFFFYLLEEYLNFQRIDYVLQSDFEILEEKKLLFTNALIRLKQEEPIQYILGKTEFYGLPFNVNKHTLIPRPETEELVEWIIQEAQKTTVSSILDIGTGTGCIPISLGKNLPHATIYAIDVSEEALKVAKENALLNATKINFLQLDILSLEILPQKYDIIVSNPPYVRNLEKLEIKNNVLQNEPHLALFVDDNNPLVFYDKIADLAKKHLNDDGLLFFEINQYLGKEMIDLLKNKNFSSVELRKDLFGNDRMIKAKI
ncbi:peptide chain release factor N(5)-glutamine methyltransferase [Tenacibaculum sp. TC6]|uniref:peptide chain release factor N(5)-glutamine methyltransferase n=1 Tax=Tenacibaculum sp. TC6 TaxID=3423223 RepID=UPI003D35BA32